MFSDSNTQHKVYFNESGTSIVKIQEEIFDSDHNTELFKAVDVTYESLPECCHYRN